MKGTYEYMHYNHDTGILVPHRVRVLITNAKSPKTYRVQLLGFHADGRPVGSYMTVRREKVTLDTPPRQEQPREPIREIRKPYKDD